MRSGGSKEKGSAWEREVGKRLSLWLTYDERPDIFSRNVLSGGAFTIATDKGKLSSRMPGDLMAAHPLAFAFLSHYLVECKHLKNIGMESLIFDTSAKSAMMTIIKLCESQAAHSKLAYLVIAKQNMREPLILCSGNTGDHLLASIPRTKRWTGPPIHHWLHRRRIFVMRFADMLNAVNPKILLGD